MTDWFRSWHGAPTDPKWLGIARRAGIAPGIAVAVAWALMDRASQAEERGSIAGYDADGLACFFGCEPEQIDQIVTAMTDKGMIVDGRFTSWEKRQPKREDGAAERAREWRERNRTQPNADKRPDTDTEADTEKKNPSPPSVVRPPRAEQGSFLPKDWNPSPEGHARALAELGSIEAVARQAEKFRNFWLAKSGKDGRKRDWEATWRNWIMTEADRGRQNGNRNAGRPHAGPDALLALLGEYRDPEPDGTGGEAGAPARLDAHRTPTGGYRC